jgi:hypothetical protein
MNETTPCVVAALENFDYETRCAALKLLGCGDEFGSVLDNTIAGDPRVLRAVLTCLSHLAWAGLVEYYGGWDTESAHWTLSREHSLAEDLANIDEHFDNRRTPLKTPDPQPPVELAAMRAECADILNTWEVRAQAQRPTLPPSVPVSMTLLRGLAIQRQRERDEQ